MTEKPMGADIGGNNPQRTLAQLGFMFLAMLDLAQKLAAQGRAAGTLDDETLARIKSKCLFEAKNAYANGMSMQDEATALSEAIGQLEELMGSI